MAKAHLLTSLDLQLCIAHYCEFHGPTPLMVTGALPVQCSHCPDNDTLYPPPSTSAQTKSQAQAHAHAHAHPSISPLPRHSSSPVQPLTTSTNGKQPIGLSSQSLPQTTSTSISDRNARANRATHRRSAVAAAAGASSFSSHNRFALRSSEKSNHTNSTTAVDAPPQNPPCLQQTNQKQQQGQAPCDSGIRKTYDNTGISHTTPCDGCALTLPSRRLGPSSSSCTLTFSLDAGGPTLRTRTPYARVIGPGSASDPLLTSVAQCPSIDSPLSSSDKFGEGDCYKSPPRREPVSAATSCSSSSVDIHTHYLDYTSTHEPAQARAFSIVRNSCLRTLSFEILPRRPSATCYPSTADAATSTIPRSPTTLMPSSSLITRSAGAALSGGPIFFGDPAGGFTTAFIFRIPDVHARGYKRVYALMALSPRRERESVKAFGFIAAYFRDLANWILQLAEAEAEARASCSSTSSPTSPNMPLIGSPFSLTMDVQTPNDASAPSAPVSSTSRIMGSSFLNATGGGLTRRMGGGPGGLAHKARGLAELVGLPDFFIELHRRFVQLLAELALRIGPWQA